MTRDEQLRYSRHMIMPEVGPEGQKRLNEARVLCVGAGGLGSPAALYLAAAGIGKLGLVDFDDVDLAPAFARACKLPVCRPRQRRRRNVSFLSSKLSRRKKSPPENYGKKDQTTVAAFLPWRGSSVLNP